MPINILAVMSMGNLGVNAHTSEAVVLRAFQSILGNTLVINFGLGSIVSDTSSQSFGWRGNEADVVLQALTAQVRKLSVRTFIAANAIKCRCLRMGELCLN